MAVKWNVSNDTTEELQRKYILRKFFCSYFRTGKDPEFWVKAVQEVEDELRKRGALG